jgi:cytochrome c oxidase subunit IV
MKAAAVTPKTIWIVWLALLGLLFATWLAARFNLGIGNTIIAILISGIKMALVILFFMQVRYDSRLIWVFVCAGFLWWTIFIALTLTDYLTRQPVVPYNRATSAPQPAISVTPFPPSRPATEL